MGTRGAFGFQINNEVKAIYNKYDSYPEDYGVKILHLIKTLGLKKTRLLGNNLCLKAESDLSPSVSSRISKLTDKESVLRYLTNSKRPIYIDDTSFLQDSLFCEWAYLINIDNNTLDVYRGLQKKLTQDNILGTTPTQKSNTTYYPVAKLISFSLSKLPSIKTFTKNIFIAAAKEDIKEENIAIEMALISDDEYERLAAQELAKESRNAAC